LVEPRVETRAWDYGTTGEQFPFWIVAESATRATILVYCEQGFGPEQPWGFLFTDDPDYRSLGMDSQWCWYLEEAFVRSGLWTGPVKGGYEEHIISRRQRVSAQVRAMTPNRPFQQTNAPTISA
jgi:hypothetical protein